MKNKYFAIIAITAVVFLPLLRATAEEVTDTTDVQADTTVTTDVTVDTSVTTDATSTDTEESTSTPETPEAPATGNLQIHKYICPSDTTVSNVNGPDVGGTYTIPANCNPIANVIFGGIHEDKNDLSSPYPGADDSTPFPIFGSTDANGYLEVSGLLSTGRYDVAEVNADGSWAGNDNILKLFCTGDSINDDNYETTFIPANGTAYCVSYSKTTATTTDNGGDTGTTTPPTDGGTGTTTPTGGNTDGNGGGSAPASGSASVAGGGGGSGYVGGGFGGGLPQGTVLGASTGPGTCDVYLNSYIKEGAKNNFVDVVKLQLFLYMHEGADLTFTGEYNTKTIAAVNAFQVKYADQVLKPWFDINLLPTPTTATGYVYKTTKREINNIMCPSLNLPIPPLP